MSRIRSQHHDSPAADLSLATDVLAREETDEEEEDDEEEDQDDDNDEDGDDGYSE